MTQAVGSTVIAGFRTYAGAEGKPVAQRSAKTGTAGSALSWLFTTLEGTVDVQTYGATGAAVAQYRDAFGAPAGSTPQAWGDGAGYMNKQVAEKTKLTNVGARTYDPILGKFLSVDPVIDTNLPQQNTGYTYAGNNPTTYTDPSGLRFYITDETGDIKRLGDNQVRSPKVKTSVVKSRPRAQPSPLPGPSPYPTVGRKTSSETPGIIGWTSNLDRVAREWGRGARDIKTAIHDVKRGPGNMYGGSRRNPDVEVDLSNGDVRIKGGDGEVIGNIDDHLEEIRSLPPQPPQIDYGTVAAVVLGATFITIIVVVSSPITIVTG